MIHGEFPKRVNDDLPDAYLFNLKMVPKWSEQWIPLLSIGPNVVPGSIQTTEATINLARDFKLVARRLYREGLDGFLRLCIEPCDYPY